MGDNGKAYATVTPELISRIRQLCRSANLILPNYTEAQLLLQRTPVDDPLDDAAAQALADELTALAPSAVVTGLPLGKYIGCAGSGSDRFVVKKLHIDRSFPGTGDLYGAVLIGSLIQGNALSAAADNAAEFVSLAIQNTPAGQDTASASGSSRCCPACARPRDLLIGGPQMSEKTNFEHRSGGAAHPSEHRQRGPYLRLHRLPSPSGGAHGLCHRRQKISSTPGWTTGIIWTSATMTGWMTSLQRTAARTTTSPPRHPSATPMWPTRTGLPRVRAGGRRPAGSPAGRQSGTLHPHAHAGHLPQPEPVQQRGRGRVRGAAPVDFPELLDHGHLTRLRMEMRLL